MTESLEKEAFVVEKLEPTLIPPALKTMAGFYFLSNFDLLHNAAVLTLFCFKADARTNNNACEVIKQALAEVLVHYYPFAGRLGMESDGRLVVKCTGEGALFVEAVADCDLEMLGNISKFEFGMVRKLVHTYPSSRNIMEMPLLAVQVTRFKCGGFVLGVTHNHCMVDGISTGEFLNSWAEIARGSRISVLPFLDRNILRSRQLPKIEFSHPEYYVEKGVPKNSLVSKDDKELVRKSFCINDKNLSHLRTLAMEDGKLEKCTNFTLVAAYTWRVMTEVRKMEADQQTKLVIVVNLRSKFNPPLPKGYFGNAICHPCCVCSAGELTSKPFSFAVKLVQDTIKSVTEEYARSATDYIQVTGSRSIAARTLLISAWTRLGYQDIDYGWGKTTQVTYGNPGRANCCFILPQCGDKKDINILMVLAPSLMDAFEGLIGT